MSSGRLGSRRLAFDVAELTPPAPLGLDHWRTADALGTAIARTRDYLLSIQHADGHWCGELEGDTILESEYILLLAFLGQGQSQRAKEAAAYMLTKQLPEGGWAIYPGGPLEISASAKAYLALKITGHSPEAEYMLRARDAIVQAGGVEKVNSFTRYYFALLGLIPYEKCPAVPPEMILLPTWMPFNIYEMSSWSRTIIVPLSLLWAFQPVSPLPPEFHFDELYAGPSKQFPDTLDTIAETNDGWINWTKFFQSVDRELKRLERWRIKPLRKRAVRRAEKWILDRFAKSDGLGAIFPPIIWSVIGLKCLGYSEDSPEMREAMGQLDGLVIRENELVRLQPCKSPVWDTAIATIALRDAGVPRNHPSIRNAVDWLLSKEVRDPGDWSLYNRHVEPAGWYFEYHNEFYPDIDDTTMVLLALSRCLPEAAGQNWSAEFRLNGKSAKNRNGEPSAVISARTAEPQSALSELNESEPLLAAIRRGLRWIEAMQSRDGGWGAFDADNTREVLTKVPFADHNAMIDPSTADITARVLEMYAAYGIPQNEPAVQRALEFIWDDQQYDHCWFGRWGVNYIYGTWQVLVGLTRIGIPTDDPRIRKAVEWLKVKQQPCGGWGETARSYDDPHLRGNGPPTASQTAWAVLGLLAAGEAKSEAVERGIQYLLDTQQPDGTWDETEFTGTGFPKVFYLRYHLYCLYFPLMALARYGKWREAPV